MNDIILWLLDVVQSVDPVLRTALAGFGILLETSVLVGLVVPGDTIEIRASEFAYVPDAIVAEPGTYNAVLFNDGTIEHDIAIGGDGVSVARSGRPSAHPRGHGPRRG